MRHLVKSFKNQRPKLRAVGQFYVLSEMKIFALFRKILKSAQP